MDQLLCSVPFYSDFLRVPSWDILAGHTTHLPTSYLTVTVLVAQSLSPSSLACWFFWPHNIDTEKDHLITSGQEPNLPPHGPEPMNPTQRWVIPGTGQDIVPRWVVSQDGGDTAINGTVLIYFEHPPDLCHHVVRGINPHGRAIIGSQTRHAAILWPFAHNHLTGPKKMDMVLCLAAYWISWMSGGDFSSIFSLVHHHNVYLVSSVFRNQNHILHFMNTLDLKLGEWCMFVGNACRIVQWTAYLFRGLKISKFRAKTGSGDTQIFRGFVLNCNP